jgi:hypothetical protein
MRLMLKLFPAMIIGALLHDLTILDVDQVIQRMTKEDIRTLHQTYFAKFAIRYRVHERYRAPRGSAG